MVHQHPYRTIEEYLRCHREIELASSKLQVVTDGRIAGVTDGVALVRLAKDVHAALFRSTFPDCAGGFRKEGEVVEVGHNDHMFSGVEPADIEADLAKIGDAIPAADAPDTVEGFAEWAARFTRDFFAVHPFLDGNGRTARAIVSAAAVHVGLAIVWPIFRSKREKRRDRERYIGALQYAHSKLGLTNAGRATDLVVPRAAYLPLARWWKARIEVAVLEEEDEPQGIPVAGPLERDDAEYSNMPDQGRSRWLALPEVRDRELPLSAAAKKPRRKPIPRS